jgi:hypothetical protein
MNRCKHLTKPEKRQAWRWWRVFMYLLSEFKGYSMEVQ